MITFNEAKERNLEKLELYVPVVARVHGESHPEFHDVRKVWDRITAKIKEVEVEKLDLNNEFKLLRKITENYAVPTDVCESYEAVYSMLAELDKAYNA